MNFLKKDGAKSDTGGSFGILVTVILLGIGLFLFTVGGKKAESDEAVSIPTEEERLAELCSSLTGVGKCKVFIAYDERSIPYTSRTETVIIGIAVLCDGADSDSVRARLTAMIDGLYGIGTNRIRIDKLE